MGDAEKAENLADDLDVAGVVEIKPTQVGRRQSNFPAQSNVARMIQGHSVMWNRSGNRQSDPGKRERKMHCKGGVLL